MGACVLLASRFVHIVTSFQRCHIFQISQSTGLLTKEYICVCARVIVYVWVCFRACGCVRVCVGGCTMGACVLLASRFVHVVTFFQRFYIFQIPQSTGLLPKEYICVCARVIVYVLVCVHGCGCVRVCVCGGVRCVRASF